MYAVNRRQFIHKAAVIGFQISLLSNCTVELPENGEIDPLLGVQLDPKRKGEDILGYLQRTAGKMDIDRYRQIIGCANAFKEGDQSLGLAAKTEESRTIARELLSHTKIETLQQYSLYRDDLYDLIQQTTTTNEAVAEWTLGKLKQFLLSEPESAIRPLLPGLSSDVIGCLVKLMTNAELIQVGQKIFNPLPGSKIGSKGYMGARVQPNSPTDHPDDIIWQVFDAWSYAVGDVVLGTNPVSSELESVAKIESVLLDVIQTFGLEGTLPNCVLAHIDIQAQVEELQPGTTGIWFQSLAGTVNANKTFDLTIDKMMKHASNRPGQYGLYFETGQGADFTNGHGAGFDMVIHEARKYGFIRALKQKIEAQSGKPAWVHVNDVAGFIGPEVFKSKEQLVRCCLEDTVMGKLHGLTIGLDICSTLHMEVSLQDLDWCINQVMPANPAYLMALPTKNDPMLSYLTTSFSDHVRVREKFGYKVDDQMWAFFKKIGVINVQGQPTKHFGDPLWVYFQYCRAKGDKRSQKAIYQDGTQQIKAVRERGVPIAEGYGDHHWDMPPQLNREVQALYEDAKESIWTKLNDSFIKSIPGAIVLQSQSENRKDYIYHPESGEQLPRAAIRQLNALKTKLASLRSNVQIIISDGLNARSLSDEGHLLPFLTSLQKHLSNTGFAISPSPIVIINGRVRAGYACGEFLFGSSSTSKEHKGIIHIIGERPGSGHHNFSAYLTATSPKVWGIRGQVDHDITRVVSGISDTAFDPQSAAKETASIFGQLMDATI